MLPIESAEYTFLEGAPALRLVIGGREAFICDVRPALLEAGYVYLISMTPGFQWEDELPVLTIPPTPGVCSVPLAFPGVTDDPGVLRLARDFAARLQSPEPFTPGAVIPGTGTPGAGTPGAAAR